MKDFFKILSYFLKNYPRETLLTITLIIFAGIAEAFGIAAFLPFFQVLLDGQASIDYIPDGAVKDFIVDTGIEINFVNIAIFIVVTIFLKALILWVALRKVSRTVSKIAADFRSQILGGLLEAKWKFFTGHKLGNSLNAIVNETFTASMAFTTMARFISSFVQLAVYSLGALFISWKIFAGAFFVGAFVAATLWVLVQIARRAGRKQLKLARAMLSHMSDMLQGIKATRAMALEKKSMQIMGAHTEELKKVEFEQLHAKQIMRIAHEPLMVATAVIGLGLIVMYTDLQSSTLAVMAVIFVRILTSMNTTQSEYQRLMNQEAMLWSVIDLIAETSREKETWSGTSTPPTKLDRIRFENIHFAHGENKVLHGVDVDIAPHAMTALIGPSGSGKTTILDLLSGFYAADDGMLSINNQDIRQLDLKLWRGKLGFVPQEVFLFNDSVRDNILMGREEFSDEQVWEALEAVDARGFVEGVEGGLDANVGEGGRKLSGGQRQRIAIARAIVHKPELLLLDEATSALDRETEAVLLDTLHELAKQITVVFISHNKTVQDFADHVYAVEAGQVTKIEEKKKKSA